MYNIFILLLSGLFILIAAMIFCNALEHFGDKLGLSAGVTGSLFVAVGTALPETIIPIISIYNATFNSTPTSTNHALEIGLGAIIGPALMISTLSMFLMAASVVLKRGLNGVLTPERSGLKRDIRFFIFGAGIAFLLGILNNFFVSHALNITVVIILLLSYFFYVLLTIRASKELVNDGHGTNADDKLYFTHISLPNNLITIIIQCSIGLLTLIYFAHVFIDAIGNTAMEFKLSPFLLSLVLIPIATELPEKINSILWIRKGKDTLAFANLTGAMVFQGLLLPVMGILFTSWKFDINKSLTLITTFIAILWVYWHICTNSKLKVWHFLINGLLYIAITIFMLKVA